MIWILTIAVLQIISIYSNYKLKKQYKLYIESVKLYVESVKRSEVLNAELGKKIAAQKALVKRIQIDHSFSEN